MNNLKLNDKIISKENPEWGVWRITKVPTEEADWYEKSGGPGSTVLFKDELRFWEKVN